nr:MAG TPA: Recombination enhancement, RecA-dependent nuclease [Caudoviricetes sp.]
MSKSIMSNERKCFACSSTYNLHRHHIYFGSANRKLSEQDGCWVYLCANHHNMSRFGVHTGNRALDIHLKQECQRKWEAKNGTREDFIKRFGKNYL